MAHYTIRPERETLHGILSKDIKPALTVRPGDSVTFQTLEGDWRLEKPPEPGTLSGRFFPRSQGYDLGHALCGPIAVQGAKPRQTLAVHVGEVVPANWGWSRIGGGDPDHMERLGWKRGEHFLLWDLDAAGRTAVSNKGHRISLNPFAGVFAVAPDSVQPVPTHLPGNHGANLDCKEIVTGSTLYLPVFVDGALFSVGDGHAAQGDGESGCTALECPLRAITLRFSLLEEAIEAPVCNSPNGWITFGFDTDLTNAAYQAHRRMVDLMQRLYAITYEEALNLSSMLVDLRITQIVNGVRGVHAVLPHDCLFIE